jgi:uncharacterized membrane protein YphA (DoxX/SURF4 family)
MNILLWVLQILLAVAFFAHGWLFLSPPPALLEQINASIRPAFESSLASLKCWPRSDSPCPASHVWYRD